MESTFKILGPELGYVDILDHETAEHLEAAASKPTEYHPLRPSNSGKCARELAYALNEYHGRETYDKQPETPESHRLLALGTPIEHHVIKMFEKFLSMFRIKYKQQILEFYRLTSEVAPELNHLVEGSLDLVIWNEQYRGVLDVKSKKDKWSGSFKSNWDETTDKLMGMRTVHTVTPSTFYVDDLPAFLSELNDPFFEANFLQLNGYACTKFLQDRGVDHGAVIQYNKNDSRMREVRFRPSIELFNKVQNKFQTVLNAVAAGQPELAPKDYILGSMKCAFCSYNQKCWGTDARQAYFNTFPRKDWPKDAPDDVLPLLLEYENKVKEQDALDVLESEIIKKLHAVGIEKVRLTNGHIYVIKELKSPYPRLVLRKGKL